MGAGFTWLARRVRRGSPEDRERGSILMMSTVGVVVAMVASALSVDLGRRAHEKRFDQKVADMAALDAVRGLTDGTYTSRAQASAVRNGFPLGSPGHVLDVQLGTVNGAGQFTQPGTDAVQVKATSPVTYAFVPGSGSVTATAVAQNRSFSSFSLGSSLANIDSTRSSLLNQTLTRLLGASTAVNVLSYQGLANSTVTLGALKTQLGYSALSVEDFMDTSIDVADLYSATAVLLGPGGSRVDMEGLSARATGSMKLGDFLTIGPGSDGAAMGAQINVLQMVVGTAELANPNTGTGFSIPSLGITIPLSGITNLAGGSVSVGLQDVTITHAPVTYVGSAPGDPITTAQLTATVNSLVNLNVNVIGVGLVNVTGTVPVKLSGANATGVLKRIYCGTTTGIDVDVTTSAVNTPTASYSLGVTLLSAPLASVTGSTTVSFAQGSFAPVPPTVAGNPSFVFPSEFFPPGGSGSTKHVGATTLSPTVTTTSSGVVSTVVGSVIQEVEARVGASVIVPLLQALGTHMASADVTANKILLPDGSLGIQCGSPGLVS